MKTLLKTFILTLLISFPVSNLTANWTQVGFDSISNRTITFLNNNTGFILKQDRSVHKTMDMGNTWTQIAQVNNPQFAAFTGAFYDEQCFAVIQGVSNLHFTTNAGNNWIHAVDIPRHPAATTSVLYLRKVLYVNGFTAFICGSEAGFIGSSLYVQGVIHKTTDTGVSWIECYRGAALDLYDIRFSTNNDMYSIWSSLLKSSDNGLSWNYVAGTGGNAAISMSEIFDNTFYLCTYNGRILKTTNGGLNYITYQTNLNDTLRKIHFIDVNRGYVVGDQGRIYYTSDGGLSWITQNSGTDKNIYDIAFINEDTIYAVGADGLILRTYNGGFTNISNVGTELPSSFSLHQNFPNPFNPSTTISFDIPQTALVKLNVYDALGREVATLVNETLTAGVYQYQFTTDKYQIPSGVYFYTITAGEYRDTKRMLLLK